MILVSVTQLSLHTLFEFVSALCKWRLREEFSSCHKQVILLLKLVTDQHKASIIIQCVAQVLYVSSLISLHEEHMKTNQHW